MACDAPILKKYFYASEGNSDLDMLTNQRMRNAVKAIVDFNVVIVFHFRKLDVRIFISIARQTASMLVYQWSRKQSVDIPTSF